MTNKSLKYTQSFTKPKKPRTKIKGKTLSLRKINLNIIKHKIPMKTTMNSTKTLF